jgi:hypothetical protein
MLWRSTRSRFVQICEGEGMKLQLSMHGTTLLGPEYKTMSSTKDFNT